MPHVPCHQVVSTGSIGAFDKYVVVRIELHLANDNLDTGAIIMAAEYRLADDAYAELLTRLDGKGVSSALRQEILSYYADLEKPYATKKNSKAWQTVIKELNTLESTPVSDDSALFGTPHSVNAQARTLTR